MDDSVNGWGIKPITVGSFWLPVCMSKSQPSSLALHCPSSPIHTSYSTPQSPVIGLLVGLNKRIASHLI